MIPTTVLVPCRICGDETEVELPDYGEDPTDALVNAECGGCAEIDFGADRP